MVHRAVFNGLRGLEYMKGTKQKLLVKDIKVDTRLWNRDGLDKHHLDRLAKDIAVNGVLVPLIVFRVPSSEDEAGAYYLVDGHHRYRAVLRVREKDGRRSPKLDCIVYQGSFEAAVEFSYSCNRPLVKPLTHKEAIEQAWQAIRSSHTDYYRALPHATAVEELGVNKRTVAKMKEAIRASGDGDMEKGVALHGDVATASNAWTTVRYSWCRKGALAPSSDYHTALQIGHGRSGRSIELDELVVNDPAEVIALDAELAARLKALAPHKRLARQAF